MTDGTARADRELTRVDRPDAALEVDAPPRYELGRSVPGGRRDPTGRVEGSARWRTVRTEEGPATIRLADRDGRLEARAWGPGAEAAVERVPRLAGFEDDLGGFDPSPHPLVAEQARRHPGLRFGRSDDLLAALVPAILGQLVASRDAAASYARLVFELGERAPGPMRLWMAPSAAALHRAGSWVYHRAGVERKRSDVVRRVAGRAAWLDELVAAPSETVQARLQSIRGIGPWTAAKTAQRAMGDPDAVPLGDYNLPHRVAWLMAGEWEATDERMLELLAPFPGHRARVIRLLGTSGRRRPRHGPRMAPRPIRHL